MDSITKYQQYQMEAITACQRRVDAALKATRDIPAATWFTSKQEDRLHEWGQAVREREEIKRLIWMMSLLASGRVMMAA